MLLAFILIGHSGCHGQFIWSVYLQTNSCATFLYTWEDNLFHGIIGRGVTAGSLLLALDDTNIHPPNAASNKGIRHAADVIITEVLLGAGAHMDGQIWIRIQWVGIGYFLISHVRLRWVVVFLSSFFLSLVLSLTPRLNFNGIQVITFFKKYE